MVCNGLLNASEMPPKSGAPGVGDGHALINGETPTNANPEAGQGLGAGLTSLQGRKPLRALVSGTRSTPVWCRCWLNPSKLVKTKVLSFLMGAPMEPPNWLRSKPGTEAPSKKLRASNRLLRRNSKSEPWTWFAPDWVTIKTCAPGRLP